MNRKLRLKLTALALCAGLHLGHTQAQTVDLSAENTGVINGVLFQWTDTQPTGTGHIDSFVRIQNKGIEQGYNTSGRPFAFDQKEPLNFTHDIQLKDLGPGTNINGTIYYQFLLDVNEPGGKKSFISLDEIKIYTSPAGKKTTADLDSLGTLRWNMRATGDNWILLDAARNHGSGSGDMFMFVPRSFFGGASPDDFVYLYSKFGGLFQSRSGVSEAGFEEWALVRHEQTDCPNAAAQGGSLTCNQATVQLQAVSSLPDSFFLWTGPNGFTSTEQNPTVRLAGTYQVTVISGNCESTAQAVVTDDTSQIGVTATGGELTCERQTVQLSALSDLPLLDYSWSGPGIVSGGNTATPLVNRPGTYIVTARDRTTGCSGTAVAVVTQSSRDFTVTATGGTLDCENLTVRLTASASVPGATFSWTGPGILSGADTANPIVNKPGTYTVTASVAGCSVTQTVGVITDVTETAFIPSLPSQAVAFKAHVGAAAAFDVELQDVPPGFSVSNGKHKGWCLEEEDALPTGYVWPGVLLDPYGPATPAAWRNQRWNEVNYILNHKGAASADDIQKAIWTFVGGSVTTPPVLSATAQALVQQAANNADCYSPGPGDVTGVILNPTDESQQALLIEVPVPGTPETPLAFTTSTTASGQISAVFTGPANINIVIDSSTDLKTWSLFKVLANPTGRANTVLPMDQYSNGRFYRARVQQ